MPCQMRPDAWRPGIRRLNAWCHGVLRPNSHCLCVSHWEWYVPCQGASRASRAPGASRCRLCVRTQIFFPDAIAEAIMTIKLGDTNEVHTRKKGMVQLNGVCIEVFFVQEFRISLLSVSQLDFQGLTAIFKNGMCTIIDQYSNNPLSPTLDRGLYILPPRGFVCTFSTATPPQLRSIRTLRKSDSIELWHRRLAHLNYADLKLILDLDKKINTLWETPRVCQTCVETKQQQHVI